MTTMNLAIVCAWCGSLLRSGSGGIVSHGVCGACSARFLAEAQARVHGPSFERRKKRRLRHRWTALPLLEARLSSAAALLATLWRPPALRP